MKPLRYHIPLAHQVRWRFYVLTPEGRRALEAETRRLEDVLARARAALGPEGGA